MNYREKQKLCEQASPMCECVEYVNEL